MLHHLSIRDVAIVDHVDIDLGPGMTVITGETGAGKSLLIDALHLLLGGRADSGLVRRDAGQATVSGLFTLGQGPQSERVRGAVEAIGIDLNASEEGAELLVRRTVTAAGRGRCFLNDVPVTVTTLAHVMDGVVDIMSQHEHQSLTSRDNQLELLDAFGGHRAERAAVTEGHASLRRLLDAQEALSTDEREKTARIEYLAYQVEELSRAAAHPGELEALEGEQRRLGSMDRLRRSVGEAEGLVYADEPSACGLLTAAARRLEEATQIDPTLQEVTRAVDEARTIAAEAARDLGTYVTRLEADPGRLAEVEDRLDLLRKLARKHSVTADQLPDTERALTEELDALRNASTRLAEIEQEVAAGRNSLAQAATALTTARQRAAARLARRCRDELHALAMANAKIEILVEALSPGQDARAVVVEGAHGSSRVIATGADRVTLTLQANPGEPPRPLAKVASGGELSRVALALRRALADRDPVPTYIFDEVDAAVGGATAEAIGRALHDVSRDHQVICISHLPQVAARADHHLRVEKRAQGRRTHVEVAALSARARVEELARMLGGAQVTATARRHARALLEGGAV